MLPPLPLDCPPQTRPPPPPCPQALLIAFYVPAHIHGHLGLPCKHCLLSQLLLRKRNGLLEHGSVYPGKAFRRACPLDGSSLPSACCLPSLPRLATQSPSYC